MIRYMLDTNICVALLREHSETLLERLRRFEMDEVGVSSITAAELQFGVAKRNMLQMHESRELPLPEFLAPFQLLPFDEHAAISYGRLRAQLEVSGQPIGPLDTLIAAHAQAAGVTLVTNNRREFGRVSSLMVEDWTTP